jgi:hypothetical protein
MLCGPISSNHPVGLKASGPGRPAHLHKSLRLPPSVCRRLPRRLFYPIVPTFSISEFARTTYVGFLVSNLCFFLAGWTFGSTRWSFGPAGWSFGPTRRPAWPPRWSTRPTGRAFGSTGRSARPTRRPARPTGRAFRASTTGRVFVVGRLCRFLIGRPHFLLCSAVRTEVGCFIGELYPTIRTEVSRFIGKLYPTTAIDGGRIRTLQAPLQLRLKAA